MGDVAEAIGLLKHLQEMHYEDDEKAAQPMDVPADIVTLAEYRRRRTTGDRSAGVASVLLSVSVHVISIVVHLCLSLLGGVSSVHVSGCNNHRCKLPEDVELAMASSRMLLARTLCLCMH